jgi:hypothetical protein
MSIADRLNRSLAGATVRSMSADHVTGTKPIPRPPRRDQFGLLRRLLQTPQTVLDELDESFGPIYAMGAGYESSSWAHRH